MERLLSLSLCDKRTKTACCRIDQRPNTDLFFIIIVLEVGQASKH